MTVPGTHVIRQGGPQVGLALEVEGYEIRDCVHVVTSTGVEQWWLARWPFTGNTIQNLVKHGVGALDIDGCRVSSEGSERVLNSYPSTGPQGCISRGSYGNHAGRDYITNSTTQGRWPPNLVFLHAEGCWKVGEKKVKGITGGSNVVRQSLPFESTKGMYTTGRIQPEPVRHLDADGKETVPEYECAEGCPVATLDVMSGVTVSRPDSRSSGALDTQNMGWRFQRRPSEIQDSGGASRFFPCFETRDELQAWFERLIGSGDR